MRPLPAPSRSFLCVRHGTTDWNRLGRFQGLTDIPLNDEGVSQAAAAARRLQAVAFDQVVRSPLLRAVTTAEIIAEACSKRVSIDPDLSECDFGNFEGRSISEVMAEHGIAAVEALATILPHDAKPWRAVSARSLACVGKWLDRYPRDNILFVSHDAVMQSMSEALCKSWFNNRCGTPFRFLRDGNVWRVEEVSPSSSAKADHPLRRAP